MNNIWKIFQYGYLVVGAICLFEAMMNWKLDREKAYLFLGFSIFITAVFFFKRSFRKKIEHRNKTNK